MAELTDTDYLSIGEVLGLLLEEFPDVTISKIRFLESQGLIDPERTPSGYRKFYETDVELLRVILREQRENYLPLRVIKDRLDSGAIDPSGELAKPETNHQGHPDLHDDHIGRDHHDGSSPERPEQPERPERSDDVTTDATDVATDVTTDATDVDVATDIDVPQSSVAAHPAATRQAAADTTAGADHTPVSPQLLPGVVLDRDELCGMVGLTPTQLQELETYGIITGRGSGANTVFGDDAVEIAKIAVQFLRAGVDSRHLRGWRTAAEREASLFEQLITPRLRQRNPESRAEAVESLRHLEELGGRFRTALMRTALRHHIDG